jgi:hypothetical protein
VTRKPDWQALLDAFLARHQFDTFQYGRWDCCLFVCDAVLVMTGVDPAPAYRGTYSSRAQSRRHGSVQANVEAVCAKHGMQEAPVPFARRGDVVLVRRRRSCSLGLVALNGREIVLTSSAGLWLLPLGSAVRAWHV